ncbi:hypothetical protein QTP86_015755, partial [Hemibagrus guttatus]
DSVKLGGLADLLMEELAAKGDAYLPGLAYLDTPCSINPIVEKLPASLQLKWLFAGSRFKEEHKVCRQRWNFGLKVFDRTENDKAAMSFEDEIFLKIMQTEFHQNKQKTGLLLCHSGHPDHYSQIIGNKLCLTLTICRNGEMKEQFSAFMGSSSRTIMQKELHLSMRMKNVGTYPSSECIILKKTRGKYGSYSIPVHNTKVSL